MKHRKNAKSMLFFVAIFALLMVMLYSGFRILEATVFYEPSATEQTVQRKTIVREGVEYFPRQDITVVMVLGIDQYGPVEDSGTYNNHGAADVVMLMIFDEKYETYHILQLNRDTMVEMPVLGIGGKEAGTYYGQLALSHTYGSGLEDSCENTRKTVSNLLYGIHIDYYISMNMDAISILNDAVGGVTVNVTEDFSKVDASIQKGEMTLMGQQAVNYVRTRKDVGDQLNLTRLKRHREYMDGFWKAFQQKDAEDPQFIIKAYQDASPYLVSDCSVNVISGMADRYGDYTMGEIYIPSGENIMSEKYYEFHLDEEKLDELIIQLFYEVKK